MNEQKVSHPYLLVTLLECPVAEHKISCGEKHYAAKGDDADDEKDFQVPS